MRVNNGKDFWAGLMFMAFGLWFAIQAALNYNMGTAVRMGPAYFPVMLGGLLAVLGLAIFLKSFASRVMQSLRVFQFRPVLLVVGVLFGLLAWFLRNGNEFLYQLAVALCLIVGQAAFGPPSLYIVLAAVVVFAFLLKPLGLLIATGFLVAISRAAGPEFKLSELAPAVAFGVGMYLLFAVIMAGLTGALGPGKAGMVGMLLVIVASVWGARKMRGAEIGALFAILGIFCVVVFGHGLGLPFNACPIALDDACRKIGLGS